MESGPQSWGMGGGAEERRPMRMQGEGAGNGLKEDGSYKGTVRNGGQSSWYSLNYGLRGKMQKKVG